MVPGVLLPWRVPLPVLSVFQRPRLALNASTTPSARQALSASAVTVRSCSPDTPARIATLVRFSFSISPPPRSPSSGPDRTDLQHLSPVPAETAPPNPILPKKGASDRGRKLLLFLVLVNVLSSVLPFPSRSFTPIPSLQAMFTPPPSPDPRAALTASTSSSSPTIPSDTSLKLDVRDDPFLSPSSASSSRSSSPTPPSRPHGETPLSPKEDPWAYAQQQHAEKKRIGRRIRWAVLLAPLVFVLVGLSTRYLTHPAALDLLSSHETNSGWAAISDWSPHKRHAAPEPAATTIDESTPSGTSLSIAATASSSASATSAAAGSGSTTVPTSKPVLPTPFPQPFDSTLSSNYSTVGCQDFMTNMTQTPAFRQCRPFSLLVQDSNAFITVSPFVPQSLERPRGLFFLLLAVWARTFCVSLFIFLFVLGTLDSDRGRCLGGGSGRLGRTLAGQRYARELLQSFRNQ